MEHKFNLKPILNHYESCLETHQNGSKAVDWSSETGQKLRFKKILEVGDFAGCTILDVGCGLGHFYEYLTQDLDFPIDYTGLDISKKMITAAKNRLPDAEFVAGDLLDKKIPPFSDSRSFDYSVACGVFTVKQSISDEEWWSFICQTVTEMYERSTKGVVFNLMTPYVDWKNPHLFYAEMLKTTGFCRSLSPYFTIHHDYPLYEFMVFIYRESGIGLGESS